MAKPATSLPSLATDTNFSAGPDSGTPTKVEPSSGQKAQGFVPGSPFVAQWWNWLGYAIGVWLAYFDSWISSGEEIVYPVSKTRIVVVPVMGGLNGTHENVGNPSVANGITQENAWKGYEQTLFGAGPGGADLVSPPDGLTCGSRGVNYSIPISAYLPSGATLTKVEIGVDPGTAQATAADRVKAGVVHGGSTVTGTADATANDQTITINTSIAIDRSATPAYVYVTSSQGANTTPDRWKTLALTFTDPGPRNF